MNAISVRRFIVGIAAVCVVIITAAWIWAINGRMWFLDSEYPMWVAKSQMIRNCAHGETTILGDSRPLAGLIPNRMGNDVVNFSLGGLSTIETLYIVEKLLKCPSRPKRIIISLGPISFMSIAAYWGSSALFGILTFQQMEEVKLASQRLRDSIVYSHANKGVRLNDSLENYYYYVSLPSIYFPAMLNASFIKRKERNERILEAVLHARGHHFFGVAARTDWPSDEKNFSKFKPSPLKNYYFTRIISLLYDNAIPVYFVGMPINEATGRAMDPVFPREFARYLEQFTRQYPNFRVLGEVLPILPAEFFGDEDHLNEAGATMWSGQVAKQISELVEERHTRLPAR